MVNNFSNILLAAISIAFCFLLVVDYFAGMGFMAISFQLLPRWLTIAAAIMPIITLFMHIRLKVLISLSMCSILVPVYGAELYFEASTYLASMLNAEKRGVTFDRRTKYEVVKELRANGTDAYPMIPLGSILDRGEDGKYHSKKHLNGVELFPLAPAIANKTTVLCNETGQWLSFLADENGFRNPTGIWSQKEVNVAIIGDSFAQGICVDKRHTPASLISAEMGKTISLGGAAAGPLSQLAVITEYLPEIKPRHILWFYFEGNDMVNLQMERKTAVLPNYLTDGFSQRLLESRDELDKAMTSVVDAAFRDRSADYYELHRKVTMITQVLALRYLRVALVGGREILDEELELLQKILTIGKRRAESWGGQIIFVYLPDWTGFYSDYTGAMKASEISKKRVLETVSRVGIQTIDIHKAFTENGSARELFSRPGRHYSEKGYQTLVNAVISELQVR